jgi:hypothetical protein
MTDFTQREYAETDLRELERFEVPLAGAWLTIGDAPDDRLRERNKRAAVRALLANLCARLPKLLALWDAVREHNAAVGDPKDYRVASYYTLKEYDAVLAALEALDAPLHKKDTP